MLAIKKARKYIEANPEHRNSQIFADLVLALEGGTSISVPQFYELDDKCFDIALEILSEWRLDRHYASKLRLLDTSNAVKQMDVAVAVQAAADAAAQQQAPAAEASDEPAAPAA
jgi:hypothetical protein